MYKVAYRRPGMNTCQPAQHQNPMNSQHKNRHIPPVNVQVAESGWTIELSVPGYKKEEITTKMEDNLLVVEGKRELSEVKYTRREWRNDDMKTSFRLPQEANGEGISASLENGVLTVFIPKKEKNVSKIEVQ